MSEGVFMSGIDHQHRVLSCDSLRKHHSFIFMPFYRHRSVTLFSDKLRCIQQSVPKLNRVIYSYSKHRKNLLADVSMRPL